MVVQGMLAHSVRGPCCCIWPCSARKALSLRLGLRLKGKKSAAMPPRVRLRRHAAGAPTTRLPLVRPRRAACF
eukprot:6063922-Alexandrium_andersonii.AAC.1